MTHTLKTIIPLAFVFAFLVATNFLYAAWTAPTAAAPGDNAPAPINVGVSTASTQVGFGMLGFDRLATFDKMQSDQYCDFAGTDCTPYSALGGGSGGGAFSKNLMSGPYVNSTLSGAYVAIVNFRIHPVVPNADYAVTINVLNNGVLLGQLTLASPGDVDGVGTKDKTTSRAFLINDATNLNLSYTVAQKVGTATTVTEVDLVLFSVGG